MKLITAKERTALNETKRPLPVIDALRAVAKYEATLAEALRLLWLAQDIHLPSDSRLKSEIKCFLATVEGEGGGA